MGARRQVLLNLLTGPTSLNDLSRAMKWNERLIKEVLCGMLREGLSAWDQQGKAYLTAKGKAQAVWFTSHPGYITASRMGKGQ